MTRTCAACGKPLTTTNARAKNCSDTCRARVSKGNVVPIPQRKAPDPTAVLLVDATRDMLAEYGRESHPLGLAALEVARSLADVNTPASAKAALAKQLEASIAAAIKGATAAENPVDAIRARRDAKRAHG